MDSDVIKCNLSLSTGSQTHWYEIVFTSNDVKISGREKGAASIFDGKGWRSERNSKHFSGLHPVARTLQPFVIPDALPNRLAVLWSRWNEGECSTEETSKLIASIKGIVETTTKVCATLY